MIPAQALKARASKHLDEATIERRLTMMADAGAYRMEFSLADLAPDSIRLLRAHGYTVTSNIVPSLVTVSWG